MEEFLKDSLELSLAEWLEGSLALSLGESLERGEQDVCPEEWQ